MGCLRFTVIVSTSCISGRLKKDFAACFKAFFIICLFGLYQSYCRAQASSQNEWARTTVLLIQSRQGTSGTPLNFFAGMGTFVHYVFLHRKSRAKFRKTQMRVHDPVLNKQQVCPFTTALLKFLYLVNNTRPMNALML